MVGRSTPRWVFQTHAGHYESKQDQAHRHAVDGVSHVLIYDTCNVVN